MSLALFKENLYLLLNKYIEIEDYAIVRDCFKRFKKSIIIKIFVRCNIYNKTKFVNNKYCVTSS